MRKVGIRRFHQNMWEELKDLPLVVTIRGRPDFLVEKIYYKCSYDLCENEGVWKNDMGEWMCEEHL